MRLVRYALAVMITLLIGGGIAIPASTFIAPALGYQVFAIRGQSMSPAIPMGAMIITSPASVSDLEVGDVVTWRGDNGVVVTHRVASLLTDGVEPAVMTQGDANSTADATPVPERAIVGVVDAWIPYAGFAMILLGVPSGLISWLSFGLALLVIDNFLIAAQTPGGPHSPALRDRLLRRGRRARAEG